MNCSQRQSTGSNCVSAAPAGAIQDLAKQAGTESGGTARSNLSFGTQRPGGCSRGRHFRSKVRFSMGPRTRNTRSGGCPDAAGSWAARGRCGRRGSTSTSGRQAEAGRGAARAHRLIVSATLRLAFKAALPPLRCRPQGPLRPGVQSAPPSSTPAQVQRRSLHAASGPGPVKCRSPASRPRRSRRGWAPSRALGRGAGMRVPVTFVI